MASSIQRLQGQSQGTRPVHTRVSARLHPARASARAQIQQQNQQVQGQSWAHWASSVSGEWEGVTASFSPDGSALPLPEYYVPAEFRKWDVGVHDWQTTCSVLAEGPGEIHMTCRRMMPTVGCEADAVAFTEEASQLGSTLQALTPDGGYFSGPSTLPSQASQANLELCFVTKTGSHVTQPGGSTTPIAAGVTRVADTAGLGADKAERMRLVLHLQRSEGQWALQKTDVHHERYDSPYRGLMELCGCGGGMSAFATVATSRPASGSVPSAAQVDGCVQAAGESDNVVGVDAATTQLVCLPLGVWYRLQLGTQGSGPAVALWAGVATSKLSQPVASCQYSSAGELVHSALGSLNTQ